MKKTSLADIAKSLGVSKTLVSLVLNGRGDRHGISPHTQEKVLQKAKELNYTPNPIARGLRTGKSNTIGLIVTDISNIFVAKMARAIEDKVQEHGYNLIICSSDEDKERELALIQRLRGWQVDGLIIMSAQDNKKAFDGIKNASPLVLIDRHISKLDSNYVGVDNYESSFQAVEHLINLGYKRIGLFTITPTHISPIADRERGYKEALREHNIRVFQKYTQSIPFNDIPNAVAKSLKELLELPKPIDALFVVNNSIALACLNYIKQNHIEVPKQLALLSFDDIEAFRFSTPTITAVAQPIRTIGEEAVKLLFKQINTKSGESFKPEKIVLPGELIIRDSSQP
ncbi:MAG: LacI family transcriptional regulator [Aureispira sp.]|nr:LacI family transcriptional regulator [Aureispira sp.]